MIGTVAALSEDKTAAYIQFSKSCRLKLDDTVALKLEKDRRTNKQNNLYWAYLSWCIHPGGGNLRSQGRISTDALHEDIKAWMREEHAETFRIIKSDDFSTADLNVPEFRDFLDLIESELIIGIFGIDTSGFWKCYEEYAEWKKYYPEGSFREFMEAV
jgi:hypothetical protein